MLTRLHARRRVQLAIGLGLGFAFGFLLQKGGLTQYETVIGQLLLVDFTVVKVMLSAMVTGMIGVHVLRGLGLVQLRPKAGSVGMTAVGALVFGVGFGLLGYCPGTMVGAAGQGALDALLGGMAGMLVGAGIFAAAYPRLKDGILRKGYFGEVTVPQLLKVNPWLVVLTVAVAAAGLLVWMESRGI